jgi:hypothetical protein
MSLTNQQAQVLFSLDKSTEFSNYILPNLNEFLKIKLHPVDTHFRDEVFLLDINRKSMVLRKKTFQSRVQNNIVLRRLDFYAGHHNPTINTIPDGLDARVIELMHKYEDKRFSDETHIHLYIDGYGEKWAFPLTEFDFAIPEDDIIAQTQAFCRYCNISKLPNFFMRDLLCMT